MKRLITISVIIIVLFFSLINTVSAQDDVFIQYYTDYNSGKFIGRIYGSDAVERISYYKIILNENGEIQYAEKYVSGSLIERLYFYDNGGIKIREVYESLQYSEIINEELSYQSDNAPGKIIYYNKNGEIIGTQEMNEYYYSKSFYDEGKREYFDNINFDFMIVAPNLVYGEKMIKGIAKRSKGFEVIFDNNFRIKRIEQYKIYNKLRRIPVRILDFSYNSNGLISEVTQYRFRHGKLYFNCRYKYYYDDYENLISRNKVLYYSNLRFIEEVIRFRYKNNQLYKSSKYINTTAPFQKEEVSDDDFRIKYDSFYSYNENGYLEQVKTEYFMYRSITNDTAYDSTERVISLKYNDFGQIQKLTNKYQNAFDSSIRCVYDDYGNIIRKEKIYHTDVRKNENLTYEYYDNGQGPLKKVIRDSFVKKTKMIEYYISENNISKLELYNENEKLIGVFKFNFKGDIIEEIKYGKNEYNEHYNYYNEYEIYDYYENYQQYNKVQYEYYDNGSVYSATIYNNESILKVFYFSEDIPYLYGDITRIDYYLHGEIFVSHYYYKGEKIKSVFYKNGEIFYVKEYLD